MKFYLHTLGCQMNVADSQKVAMVLMQSGFSRTPHVEEADVAIFNTCSVRQKGEDRVFGFLQKVKEAGEKRGRPIYAGLTGCMVRKTGLRRTFHPAWKGRTNATNIQLLDLSEAGSIYNEDDRLFAQTKTIDFLFRIEETGALPQLLSAVFKTHLGQDDKFQDYLRIAQLRDNPASAEVIVQTGCDNFCTFCIVPQTRGREVSRPLPEIVDEVRRAVEGGAKEVTLLGQNVNSYGKETKKALWNAEELKWADAAVRTPFRELLEAVGSVPGLDRIRFTSSNPHDMTRDILDAHGDVAACCPYLHFALQSGSDAVLKRMNRKHSYADFAAAVRYLRSKDPLFSVSTDIIVGFPGETEEEFQETVRAFRELEFDNAFTARYSPRTGTAATLRMADDVPADEKARRWDLLNRELYASIQRRNALMLGRVEKVLVAKIDDEGECSGRTRNFKDVFFEGGGKWKVGDLVPVKITELSDWVLKGEAA